MRSRSRILRALYLFSGLFAVGLAASPARADVAPAPFDAFADSTIYSWGNTRNGGAAPEIVTGVVGASGSCSNSGGVTGELNICSQVRRGLLRFDISSIPAGSVILTAKVQL